jgi:excisionase family DNA binding protein
MERLVTVRWTAAILHVREGTIRSWLARRRLPKVKLGRAVRIPVTAIEELIREGTVPADGRQPAKNRGFKAEA